MNKRRPVHPFHYFLIAGHAGFEGGGGERTDCITARTYRRNEQLAISSVITSRSSDSQTCLNAINVRVFRVYCWDLPCLPTAAHPISIVKEVREPKLCKKVTRVPTARGVGGIRQGPSSGRLTVSFLFPARVISTENPRMKKMNCTAQIINRTAGYA